MLPRELPEPAPLPAELLAARAAVEAVLRDLMTVPDAPLGVKPWAGWRDVGDAELRYGLYHIYEQFEKAELGARAAGGRATQAGAILAQATAARWELHGVLLPLADLLDADPGGGEWTLRQTLGHVVGAQASYSARTAYATHRLHNDPSLPVLGRADIVDGAFEEAPTGDMDAIRQRLDRWLDIGIAWLISVDDDAAMAAETIWSDYPVDVRFRLHRWSSHIREHLVQVEKTLAMLKHEPTEVARIVRIIAAAYGRLEGEALARPATQPVLTAAIERVQHHAKQVLAAAKV